MTPPEESRGGLPYRLGKVEEAVHGVDEKVDDLILKVDRLESLPSKVEKLGQRAWWVVAAIITALLSFAGTLVLTTLQGG